MSLYGQSMFGVAGTITGPKQRTTFIPGVLVELYFQWIARNTGAVARRATMRLNLQIDSSAGDISQYIREGNGVQVGGMSPALEVFADFPKSIQPNNSYDFLNLLVRFDSSLIWSKQGSVNGFNWWIFELTMWDVELNELAGGDSRFEVRDWFKLV